MFAIGPCRFGLFLFAGLIAFPALFPLQRRSRGKVRVGSHAWVKGALSAATGPPSGFRL